MGNRTKAGIWLLMPVAVAAWVVVLCLAISRMGSLGSGAYLVDAANLMIVGAFVATPVLALLAIALDANGWHGVAAITRITAIGLVTMILLAAAVLVTIAIGTPPRFE